MSPETRDLQLGAPTPPTGMPPAIAAQCGLTADEWTRMLVDLLPRGAAWPRDSETVLWRFWSAVAIEPTRIQGRDCDLLAESYPCGALELLEDWERVCGLPDECTAGEEWTLDQRRQFVCSTLAARGGQSPAYYIALAAAYGFTIQIVEHWPWRLGCSEGLCDVTVGVPWHWWEVVSTTLPISYITVGCWNLCDDLCTIVGRDVLECIIRRDAPAHTLVTFNYQITTAYWNTGRWNRDAWTRGTMLATEKGA